MTYLPGLVADDYGAGPILPV